ncbi:MAG: Hsp20/alpha crystallin family protein [Nanoarchaeota archaeon]
MNELRQLMQELDEKSKAIVWHVWRNGHARIGELTKLINEESDSNTLTRLREVINPLSNDIMEKPVLCFEEKKIDPLTGDKVLFSWWLNDGVELLQKSKEMLDIFDGKDELRIVTELPGVEENDIKIELNDNVLVISAGENCKRIPLLYKVDGMKRNYKNGILEVRLKKL